MNKNKLQRIQSIVAIVVLLIIIVVWAIILFTIGPQKIVNYLGINNSYFILFIMAFVGGISIFTLSGYTIALITLVAGGTNPYISAIIGTLGLTIGELLLFNLILLGTKKPGKKYRKRIKQVSKWLDSKPKWLIPLFIPLYIGLTPLPNEALVISLAIIKYPLKKVAIPLLSGNFIQSLIVALIAKYGYLLFFKPG